MQRGVSGRLIAIALLTFVAACGGGGGGVTDGGTPPVALTTPTPTPSPTPTAVPTSASTSIPLSTQATSVPLPQVAGFGGTIQIPAASTSATVQMNVSTNPPSGVRGITARHALTETPNTPYLYFTLSTSSAVTLSGALGLTVSLPSNVSAQQSFYLAALANDGTWGTFAGPATVNGSALSFSTPITLLYSGLPNQAFVMALYAGSLVYTGAPIVALPSSIMLMDLNASQTLTIGGSDPNATYTLNAGQCAGIANATQTSATTYKIGAAALGTCNLVITDNHQNSLAVFVTVTTTSVTIQ